MNLEFDIVVVGAGPSGSLAAQSLARRGRNVAIFHWRPGAEKSCGGGVPARALRSFGNLLEGVPFNAVGQLRVTAPRGSVAEITLTQPIRVYSRRELDGALLRAAQAAGARRIDARVRGLERYDDGFLLQAGEPGSELLCFARYLVCADGASGNVREHLLEGAFRGNRARGRMTLEPDQFSRSFNTYPAPVLSHRIDIAFFENCDGYAWSFPRIDHASVGICEQDLRGGSRPLKDRLHGWVEAAQSGLPAAARGIGGSIPSLRRNGSKPAREPAVDGLAPSDVFGFVEGPRFCLVGDAALAVDPITREGIHFAMLTGNAVGETDPLAHPGRYQRWFDHHVRVELEAAAGWARRFYEPRFLERMVKALQVSPALRRLFARLIAGEQSYRTLSWALAVLAPDVLVRAIARRLRRSRDLARDP